MSRKLGDEEPLAGYGALGRGRGRSGGVADAQAIETAPDDIEGKLDQKIVRIFLKEMFSSLSWQRKNKNRTPSTSTSHVENQTRPHREQAWKVWNSSGIVRQLLSLRSQEGLQVLSISRALSTRN